MNRRLTIVFPALLVRAAVASLLLSAPNALVAEVASDFALQPENSLKDDSPNAFPGIAGEGWTGPWDGRRYLADNPKNKKYQQTLDGARVVEVQGKRFLEVGPWEKGGNTGAGVARGYGAFGELDIKKPYTISCTIRFERLPKGAGRDIGNQFFFIGENATSAVGVTSATAWCVQAFYGRKAGESVQAKDSEHRLHSALQRQWNMGDSAGGKEFIFVPTKVGIKEGIEYELIISINPPSFTYVCEIVDGNTHFTSEPLRFNAAHPLGRNLVFGSRHLQGDPATFQIGNIRISQK